MKIMPGFDISEAKRIITVAGDTAYLPPAELPAAAAKLGYTDAKAFGGETGTQAIILSNEKEIVVAFRGTDDEIDKSYYWDFFPQVQTPLGGHMQGSFMEALQQPQPETGRGIWQDMQEHLQGLQQQKPRPITYTGHSLGGGLAVTAAADAYSRNDHIDRIYVSGALTTGDQQFVDAFNTQAAKQGTQVWNVENHNDPTPSFADHIPFLRPYAKVGTPEIGGIAFLTKNGSLLINPSQEDIWEEKNRDGILETIGSGSNHDRYQYIAKLNHLEEHGISPVYNAGELSLEQIRQIECVANARGILIENNGSVVTSCNASLPAKLPDTHRLR